MQTSLLPDSVGAACPLAISVNLASQVKEWIWQDVEHGREIVKFELHDRFRRAFGIEIGNGDLIELLRQALVDHAYAKFQAAGGNDNLPLLPGFGLPLGHLPPEGHRFPVLVGNIYKDWRAATLSNREICMLSMIQDLTDKFEWWRKVRDASVTARWKKEAVDTNWASLYRAGDCITPVMAEACINEILKKADIFEETGLVPVLDYSACVVKSDTVMDDMLAADLKTAVKPLECVQDGLKDWHPGSYGKVLNLVHPSLYPLVYGRSRILTDQTIQVENALQYCGMGTTIPSYQPVRFEPSSHDDNTIPANGTSLSTDFQWLPCDVAINGTHAKINSYINNLHPREHRNLYHVIERFIEKSLAAWDLVYRWPKEFGIRRITYDRVIPICTTEAICGLHCDRNPEARPLDEDEGPRAAADASELRQRDISWFMRTHPLPEPDGPDCDASYFLPKASDIKTAGGFFGGAKNIQVICKLANIHLTPEKPAYAGGTWHVEGQLNEHICATALFYYDSENVTNSCLKFRTTAGREQGWRPAGLFDSYDWFSHEQDDTTSIRRAFGIDADGDVMQNIGQVDTRPGRALFFPNVFQHRVSPFRLHDTNRNGHRKILALFLVDPAIPIISTSRVPPQRRDWWAQETGLDGGLGPGALPQELMDAVLEHTLDSTIADLEAKHIRRQLINERMALQGSTEATLRRPWSFCEH